jgi:hypothetical protein
MTQPPTPKPAAPNVQTQDRKWESNADLLALVESTKEPGRHYRWVRSRGDEYHSAVAKAKLRGYRVELRKEGGVQTVVEPDSRGDNVIAIGDVILMSCPIAVQRQREDARFRRNEALLASATAETEQMAKEKGISLIKDADHSRITSN